MGMFSFGYKEFHRDLRRGCRLNNVTTGNVKGIHQFLREQSVFLSLLVSLSEIGLSITRVVSARQECLDSVRIRAGGLPNTL